MKLLTVICSFLLVAEASVSQPTLTLTKVIGSLNSPIQLVNAGDSSGRIFIVQKGGSIQMYDKNYTLIGTFLTVTDITTSGERGLLSMAFHPDYIHNGFFYVYYTNGSGDLEVARYKVSANVNVADAASKVILKTIPHPGQSNHNGGELHFGADGYLYLSTGDGGGAGDVPNNAQTTTVLLGKILRFKVNTSNTSPYYDVSANAENPYNNEVYALGLRNPFRWSFDRLTHDIWIGDVGQDSYEEINFRPADSIRGSNFGWRCYEGGSTYNTTGCAGASNYIFPVYFYPTQNPSAAITGGTVYRGATYIDFYGYYVAADFYTDTCYKIKYDTTTHTFIKSKQPILPSTGIVDFGETEDGELYAVDLLDNSVYRVVSSGAINYVFNGNGNWEDANNWSNKTIPPLTLPSGSVITIDPMVTGECVLNLNTIQTISSGATLNVISGKKFRIVSDLIIQ